MEHHQLPRVLAVGCVSHTEARSGLRLPPERLGRSHRRSCRRNDPTVLWVAYSQHKHFHRYEANDLEDHSALGGSHADVYVAAGTHANYPDICESSCHNWDTHGIRNAEAPHAGSPKTVWYYNATTNGSDFGCFNCLIDLDHEGKLVNEAWNITWGWGGSPTLPGRSEPSPSGSAPHTMVDAPVSPSYQYGN